MRSSVEQGTLKIIIIAYHSLIKQVVLEYSDIVSAATSPRTLIIYRKFWLLQISVGYHKGKQSMTRHQDSKHSSLE